LFIPSAEALTGLTGAFHQSDRCRPYWVLARVNILVYFLVFRFATISSLVLFGAREVGFLDLGFPAHDWFDRYSVPT
jgi:hypothetical protein